MMGFLQFMMCLCCITKVIAELLTCPLNLTQILHSHNLCRDLQPQDCPCSIPDLLAFPGRFGFFVHLQCHTGGRQFLTTTTPFLTASLFFMRFITILKYQMRHQPSDPQKLCKEAEG